MQLNMNFCCRMNAMDTSIVVFALRCSRLQRVFELMWLLLLMRDEGVVFDVWFSDVNHESTGLASSIHKCTNIYVIETFFSLFLLFKLQTCTVIPLWNRWWRKEKKWSHLTAQEEKKISVVNSSTLIHIHIYLIWMFIMSTLDGYFALPVLPVVLWTLFYGYFMHTQNYDTVRFTRNRRYLYFTNFRCCFT